MIPIPFKSRFDLPLKALVAMAALVFSIEIHELVHLLTARLMGIPSRYLNFTAVGVPMADALKYPPGELAVMNGIAPLFSIVVLGCGTYFWLKGRPFKRSWRRYFLTWVSILNLPYLGLQMMAMGGPSQPNGGGNDFATVFNYFGVSHFLRAWLGLAASLVACQYQIVQKYSQAGPWLLSEFVFWALASIFFVSWSSHLTRALFRQWLAPCIMATLILVPVGLEGNDFLMLWIFLIPIVLGGIYFRTRAESNLARQ